MPDVIESGLVGVRSRRSYTLSTADLVNLVREYYGDTPDYR